VSKTSNSVLTVLIFFYPSVTQMTLSLFNCVTVEEVTYLTRDMRVECYKGRHLFWVLVNGVPMLIIWVIGMPLFGFLMLLKNRKTLRNPSTLAKYRLLYVGLKAQYFYWEFMNIFRKVGLLIINVFVTNIIIKILSSVGVLVMILFF
jgi:hypothetical protein